TGGGITTRTSRNPGVPSAGDTIVLKRPSGSPWRARNPFSRYSARCGDYRYARNRGYILFTASNSRRNREPGQSASIGEVVRTIDQITNLHEAPHATHPAPPLLGRPNAARNVSPRD